MKPKDWDKLSDKEKKDYAVGLMSSYRGVYIMSQALTVAVDELKKEESSSRENSIIQDMEILRDELFPVFYYTQISEKEFKEMRKKVKGNVDGKR